MHKKMNRWQAFAIHLVISLVIFLVIIGFILWRWYPGALVDMGGWRGIKIVAFVDLVLGPLLTLIVFNTAKKHLKWDLCAIAVLQFSCLSYGVYVIESQRVAAQVLFDDKLSIFTKSDFAGAGVSLGELKKIDGRIPALVFMDLPEDPETIAMNISISKALGEVPAMQADKYLSLHRALTDRGEEMQHRVQWRLDRLTYDMDKGCYWLPVISTHYRGRACLTADQSKAEVVAVAKDEP